MGIVLLLIAIIPVMLLGWYIYHKDRNKEPTPLLIGFFFLGIAAAIVTLAISFGIDKFIPIIRVDTNSLDPLSLFIHVFIFVALIEELSKWIFAYFVGYNNKEFDEMYDMIVYAVFIALGFACIENIVYVFAESSISVGIYRGLLAVPGHTCFGIFMGYYLSMAKFYNTLGYNKMENINKAKSIIIPVILHGIYDYCCMINSGLFILAFFVFVICLYIFAHGKLKYTAGIVSKVGNTTNNKYCPKCGSIVTGNFCTQCGCKQQ